MNSSGITLPFISIVKVAIPPFCIIDAIEFCFEVKLRAFYNTYISTITCLYCWWLLLDLKTNMAISMLKRLYGAAVGQTYDDSIQEKIKP
jgi:hypothetical protein